MRFDNRIRKGSALVGGAALLMVAGGIAAVAAPEAPTKIPSGGEIKLCYNEKAARTVNGGAALRIFDADRNEKKCKRGDDKLTVELRPKGGFDGNADTLDGIDSSGFLRALAKAADADKLDGIDSSGFLQALAKAADADKLDGIDSSGFVAAGSAGAGLLTARITGLPAASFFVPPGSPDQFGAISGISSATGSQDATTMISPPVPVVARDLSVRFTVGVLGGNRVVTLVVNGADTPLSCMVAPEGAPGFTCTSANSVLIPSNSTLVLKVHTSVGSPFTVDATDALVSFRTTTP